MDSALSPHSPTSFSIVNVIKNAIKKEPIITILLVIFILFTVVYPENISKYPEFIDWRTIIALAGLIVVTTGVKESRLLQKVSIKLVLSAKSQRRLALLLITISALLSTFLTNDVTLLIVVPLTLSMSDLLPNSDVGKLVVFEAIAVNVGSALTPIGNPQNLFLWHKWAISFIRFCLEMSPLVGTMFVILVIFTLLVFRNDSLSLRDEKYVAVDKKLSIISIALTAFYIVALELKFEIYALFIVIFVFLISYRKVLLKSDWALLVIFVLMFLDVGCIARMPAVMIVTKFLHSSPSTFVVSAFISQIMSNVPAAMFVAHFSKDWKAITYGVNVGGNGIIVASLANLIALRFAGNRLLLEFHKYSIVYFAVSIILIYLLFFAL